MNGDTFVADKPRVRADKLESAGGWDLAPDGRIVAVVPIEAPAPPAAPHTVVVLQNFFDELRRRVGRQLRGKGGAYVGGAHVIVREHTSRRVD